MIIQSSSLKLAIIVQTSKGSTQQTFRISYTWTGFSKCLEGWLIVEPGR